MIKCITSLCFLFLGTMLSFSQDIIVKTTNDTVRGKILKIDDDNIQYQTSKDNVITNHTISRKYVSTFEVNAQPEIVTNEKIKQSSFRLTFASGVAFRYGETERTGNLQLDNISDELKRGFGIETEIQYFFDKNYGIAFNLNYAKYSATVYGGYIVSHDIGVSKTNKETQTILFLGPAFAMRYDIEKWLFTATAGFGALFFSDNISLVPKDKATCTTFGLNIGVGAEYKLSKHFSLGLKISSTMGSTKSLYMDGTKYTSSEPLSLSSSMLLAYISFRTN
ncbi:MAG: outer membrane beta-barrel protein [Prevotellaceae bacterium]|jgi:opacity protein-like surface antigen|nr:outer membrane beta-barrel protein [Prevotellaceae bacterium]